MPNKDVIPIPNLGPKGGHVHKGLPSDWNPLKETSVVLTDHNTGTKSSFQVEVVKLPEGEIPLFKKDGKIIL
jgi:hypothetical protein